MPNLGVMQRTVDQYQKDLGSYQKEVRQFNFDADVYNKQLKEYQALVDAYNNNPAVIAYDQAARNYNENLLPTYRAAVDAYNQRVNDWNNRRVRFTNGNAYIELTPAQMQERLSNGSVHPNSPNGQAWSGQLNQYRPGAAPSAPATPVAPNVQRPGDFTAVRPELTATPPKDPGFTNQQMQLLAGKQSVAQQERSRDSGLVSGAQEALKQSRDEGSMIGGLLARARYST